MNSPSEFKEETKEEKVMRIVTRILAAIVGLLILFVISTSAITMETLTVDDVTSLRIAAMLGFMGWLFVYVSTMRPRK